MSFSINMEDIFFTFIKEQTQEYVQEGFITEGQRQQIIQYHETRIERDRNIQKDIFNEE